ncbi:YceI family protein [Methylotenera sp.]|uniref:YceI family protein n=1 Tax=Methylotenera sp. TaxID=2051956 RepID=UPI00271D20BF|nr:YceI family protein [Methylotenera sp.]MDO9206276.1 YceI family protein [Methylotenera sp.]MDP2072336.1 YceI family protein [Methylotenera sp.]MDP3005135.1 YceI family protein [Methylotenera sp.]
MKNSCVQISILITSVLLSSLAMAAPETYKIDNAHSFANWTIRHVASKTSGTFSDVTGKVLIDQDNLANSSVEAKINVLSINTSHAKRDEHIKKEDYLDAVKFGEMTFVSTKVTAKNSTEGVLTGNFTMHGVTKEISFPFKLLGFGTDPWGGYRTGIEAHTMIKASDYGFGWATKAGAPVGDDIEVTLLIEGVKLAPEKASK